MKSSNSFHIAVNDNACCYCVHEYGTRLCLQKKEGQVYKEGSSCPRQGCQLTKAAQHVCV